LARTDWLSLQRVYDRVLALPLSILCVTSRTSARTGASLIRVGVPADFRKSIVMESSMSALPTYAAFFNADELVFVS
jgi:hypothetical protein